MIKIRCLLFVTFIVCSLGTYSQTVQATKVELLDGGNILFKGKNSYYTQGLSFFNVANQLKGGLTYHSVSSPLDNSITLGLGSKQMIINSNGNTFFGYSLDDFTGIGNGFSNTLNIKGTLFVRGSIKGNAAGGALQIETESGSIEVGSKNASWAHIYTDRPKFIFNKSIYSVEGKFSSHLNTNLFLQTGGNTKMTVASNGNVGIGTTTPEARFHIKTSGTSSSYPSLTSKGDILQILQGNNNGIEFGTSRKVNDRRAWILARHTSPSYGQYYSTLHLQPNVGDKSNYRGVALGYNASDVIPVGTHLAVNGNVGIGTTDTGIYKLAVNGSMRSKEVVVEPSPWPDYVFKDSYDLPKLEEVEEYINKQGHLKNIPSAKEVQENGVKLGEINTKLLEKIEELTLYTIQQQKEIKNLKEQNEKLKILDTRLNLIEKLLENTKNIEPKHQ